MKTIQKSFFVFLLSPISLIFGASEPIRKEYIEAVDVFWSPDISVDEREKAFNKTSRIISTPGAIIPKKLSVFQSTLARMGMVLALLKLPSEERAKKFQQLAEQVATNLESGENYTIEEQAVQFTPSNLGEIAKMILSAEKEEKKIGGASVSNNN